MSGARETTRAVILARGLGTRMRRADPQASLDPQQAAMAETGIKGMIPVGRPFLDFVLSGLADAGFREACLVIGPEHQAVRDRYQRDAVPRRIRVAFAVQQEPRGTADAVLAAEEFAAGEPFLVLNSDNYYPSEVLAALRESEAPAVAGFDRDALVQRGNVPEERIAKFAVLRVAPDGTLQGIVEKPEPEALRALGSSPRVSMNCWVLTAPVLEACRRIAPSPRGELELPSAVEYAIDRLGVRFRVLPVAAPVLDLSGRADIPEVARRLSGVEVRL